jgi:DNA-binding MarR family transcriptional regulator
LIDEDVTLQQREPMHVRLVGARLFGLLRLIRESGLPVYEREIGYKEIHRQLIIMIGASGGLSSHEIVALTGHEKAQVSRAIKPLEQGGLIERERLRAKLTLLPPGRKIFDRIMAIVRTRDTMLTAGIAAPDLKRFAAITEQLTVQAAQIYAEERRLSVDAGIISACSASSGALPPWPTGPDGRAAKPPPSSLITPKLISLVAYLKRSAMLAYQRTHGLSHFQWQVLSLIGECPPVPLARLIIVMGRDKSQVGRTVGYLEQAGLIERSRPTRRRDIMLEPTQRDVPVDVRSGHGARGSAVEHA